MKITITSRTKQFVASAPLAVVCIINWFAFVCKNKKKRNSEAQVIHLQYEMKI